MSPAGVIGIGVDLVETRRMQEALDRWDEHFKDRVFNQAEQDYCETKNNPFRHYAGRFAVKEAVSKAFGTGIGEHVGWLDIEVTRNDETGEPFVQLHGKAKSLADARGVSRVLISLSHTHDFAIAQALLSAQ